MLMYFIINLSGSQQFSGSSIQNQVELSEWVTGRFMHCSEYREKNNMVLLKSYEAVTAMAVALVAPPVNER